MNRRILVKIPKFAGDVIMALPALRALRALFPDKDAEITLLVSASLAQLVAPDDAWRVLIDDTRRPAGGAWRRARIYFSGERGQRIFNLLREDIEKHRGEGFTEVISLTREIDYLRAFDRVGIPSRYGWDQLDLRVLGRLNRPITLRPRISDPGRFGQAQYFLRMIEAYAGKNGLNWPPPSITPRPALNIPPEVLEQAFRDVVQNLKLQDETGVSAMESDRRYYTIVATSSGAGESKRWPLQYFVETARLICNFQNGTKNLSSKPILPIFSFGPGEDEVRLHKELVSSPLWSSLREKCGAIAVNPGSLNWRQMLGLIGRGNFVLTNDTGPRHAALALGIRTVTIFGPSPLDRSVYSPHLERALRLNDDCRSSCDVARNRCYFGRPCLLGLKPEYVAKQIIEFCLYGT
jgi:ADP-heptose:LPS heptosyltransferase